MGDYVAYDGRGKAYLVNNNIIDSDSMNVLVSNLKKENLTDAQIRERISDIELIMMDIQISARHPETYARKAAEARLGELSEEDREEVLAMTDPYQITRAGSSFAICNSRDHKKIYDGWRKITHIHEDPCNPDYVEQDLSALNEA
jgi:hypothetical protein